MLDINAVINLINLYNLALRSSSLLQVASNYDDWTCLGSPSVGFCE